MGEGGRGQIMEVVWRDGISPDTCEEATEAPQVEDGSDGG